MNARKTTLGGSDGFTLLEVLISSVILALVIGSIYGVLASSSSLYKQNMNITYLQASGGIIQERLMAELAYGTPLATTTEGTSITFWTPVDADGVNGPLSADGEVEWGYDGRLGYSRRMDFVVDSVLDEAILGQDVNGNGHTNDRFFLGRLTAVTLDESGAATGAPDNITPPMLLVNAVSPGGDVDGDGRPDPIFGRYAADGVTLSATGSILKVKLCLLSRDAEFGCRLETKDVTVKLRNTDAPTGVVFTAE